MERLLVLRLESIGIAAEAVFNGVPLLRTTVPPAREGDSAGTPAAERLSISVNEYALAGSNTLQLRVQPPPPGPSEQRPETEPWCSEGQRGACLRLLLPRVGQRAHPEVARTLAQLDWAPAAGSVVELPADVTQVVDLPINFPRWRWLDAPPVADPAAVQGAAVVFLQGLALGLSRGDADPLLQASALRLDELAQAYQHKVADSAARWRAQLQQLHAALPLRPVMPKASTVLLRPVAGGRLLECLTPQGQPLLHSPVAGGGQVVWPLRLSAIDGRFYVLR